MDTSDVVNPVPGNRAAGVGTGGGAASRPRAALDARTLRVRLGVALIASASGSCTRLPRLSGSTRDPPGASGGQRADRRHLESRGDRDHRDHGHRAGARRRCRRRGSPRTRKTIQPSWPSRAARSSPSAGCHPTVRSRRTGGPVEDSVYVKDGYRGKGLGAEILEELVARARARGHRSMVARVTRRTSPAASAPPPQLPARRLRTPSRVQAESLAQVVALQLML